MGVSEKYTTKKEEEEEGRNISMTYGFAVGKN